MSHMTKPLIALALLALVIPANTASAQRDAGSKIRGEYNFNGNSGGSAMRSARDYSTYYREYAQTAPKEKVNPEVAREAADSIGQYITKAQKHMVWMRKQAVNDKDKETLTSLDVIDQNLADASKSHAEMHETCLKENVDGTATMNCCKVIDASLAKAIAEHDKLMKRLATTKK